MEVLFKTLGSIDLLQVAWKIVSRKKSAGGIDAMTLTEYDRHLARNLKRLSAQLECRKWVPKPYLSVKIPKKETEFRSLNLLTVEDKIVQQAIKILIEPILEKDFCSCSYAYRPGRGHLKAVRRALHECKQRKNVWYAKLDIDDFFDNIDHAILFGFLRSFVKDTEICRLVELCMQMGQVDSSMKWSHREKGIPQGGILSPILSNLYLNTFDRFVQSQNPAYVRYADDFVIWGEDESNILSLCDSVVNYLQQHLKLSLNQPLVGMTHDGFEFLGLHLNDKGATISEAKRDKLRERISQFDIVDGRISDKYIESLSGIRRYYLAVLSESDALPLQDALYETLVKWVVAHPEYSKSALHVLFSELPCMESGDREQKRWIARVVKEGISQRHQNAEGESRNQKLIRARKLEYQRREGDNSELVVSSFGYFIGLSNRGITLKRKGERIPIPPSSALKHITIMSNGVSISSNAISYCMEKGIPIDFFSGYNTHIASIISPKFLQTTLWPVQAALDLEKRTYIGKKIIQGKLRNQLNLIKYFHKYHKTVVQLEPDFMRIQKRFLSTIEAVKSIASTNRYKEELMAQEAQGAVLYWEYIKLLIADDDVGFGCRDTRGASDLVNVMLNTGYSLLYPRVWQSILRHHLNPYMGFVHYQEGNANLVFDMIELFRSQAVDRVVISMIQKGERLVLSDGRLDAESRALLVQNVFGRMNRYEKYRGKEHRFLDIIDFQMKELISYMTEGNTYYPYIAKW